MTLQETIISHLGNLPERLHAEVLDFVLFLEHKQAARTGSSQTSAAAQRLADTSSVGEAQEIEPIDSGCGEAVLPLWLC